MGGLTPGATLIYERAGNTVYSREAGSAPSTRVVVGHDYKFSESDEYGRSIARKYFFEQEWLPILDEAEHNELLQAAIERAILIYHLSKDKPNE
jgi:hypothetical protein